MTDGMNLASGISAFESKHFSRAMQLLGPLADDGNDEAQYRVAVMCQNGLGVVRNESKAYEYMALAAEDGHPLAQHGLGFMYMNGECVEKDIQKAAHWFEQAAEQGLEGSRMMLEELRSK